ncbi:MAG: rhamnan synthesis F family protein [Lachnospiraceae bacterium]|nr:rhamnan synthesis F family protein [Lachnospiraceae bacterium]
MILEKDKIRRCAIFLFFDKDGVVDDYIPHMLEDMRTSVEYILVISNGFVNCEGLRKLKAAADDVYCRANLGLDVGGYREGLFYLGFQKLQEYDEMVMLNYTFFAPLYPFSEMFDSMASHDVDFWGITKHHTVIPDPFFIQPDGILHEHIQSFFLVLRTSLFLSYQYKDFMFNMQNPKTYTSSIIDYETIFTKHFEDLDFKWEIYADTAKYEGYSYCPNMFYIRDMLKDMHCPMIKRRSFFTDYNDFLLNTCGESSSDLYDYIQENLNYNLNDIWDNILRLENVSDVHLDMHFNYMLPVEGTLYEMPKEKNTVIFVVAAWTKRMSWYKRFLKKMPENADICILASEESVAAPIRACIAANPKVSVFYKQADTSEYKQVFSAMGEVMQNNYQYVGILYMQDLELLRPYSNSASLQYSDWENIAATQDYVCNILEVFDKNERLGMIIPPIPQYGRYFTELADGWAGRYEDVSILLGEMGINVNLKSQSVPLTPYGGSFWIRQQIFSRILEWLIRKEDAEIETILVAMPYIVQHCGYYTGVAYSDRYAPIAITNKDYMFRENNKTVFQKYGPNYHSVCVDRIKNNEFL